MRRTGDDACRTCGSIGVHEDGQHLLLSDAEGQRFRVALDEPLRAAARRDRPRLGQLQIEIDGGLRPREVQALIRAGPDRRGGRRARRLDGREGAPLRGPDPRRARVTSPAWPARSGCAAAGRRTGSAPRPCRAGSRERLRGPRRRPRVGACGTRGAATRGAWTVVLTFPAGGRQRQAAWPFDPVPAPSTAADDEARWLSEDEPTSMRPAADECTAGDDRLRRRGRGRRGRVARDGPPWPPRVRPRGGAARPHDGDAAADHGRAAFRSAAGGLGRAGSAARWRRRR